MSKYNIKSMAIGVGIGLIIAATFNIRVASKPMPLKFLDEQAKFYGKVLVPEDFLTNKVNPTLTPSSEPTTTPITSLKPPISLKPAISLKPTIQPSKVISVSFTVTDNTSSETVANWLSKATIVDKNEFLAEMNRRGLSTKVRNGSYTFKKGVTQDEIIKVLTGR